MTNAIKYCRITETDTDWVEGFKALLRSYGAKPTADPMVMRVPASLDLSAFHGVKATVMPVTKRKSLLALKARVLAALRSAPIPHDDTRTLADLNNKVQAQWKGRPHILISGKSGSHVGYGSEVQTALEAAGLKVYYGLHSPVTGGRWVGGTYHEYIEIPLDQITGPFGYDCA